MLPVVDRAIDLARCRLWVKTVADAGFGQDVAWTGRIGLQFLPETSDIDPEVVVLLTVRRTPDLVHQKVVGQDAARISRFQSRYESERLVLTLNPKSKKGWLLA